MKLRKMMRRLRHLRADTRGLAMIELAYSLPFLTLLGLGGIELANFTVTHMRVSQLAVSLADNASRAKQFVATGSPQFREHDVAQVFTALEKQSGGLDLRTHGRAILSSLEVNSDGGQWIHWQRCFGTKTAHKSAYGQQGTGSSGKSFPGMGPSGHKVQAEADFAIMYVEVYYDYQPVAWAPLIPAQTIKKTAAMYVRDDRDLSQIFNPDPKATVQSC